MSRTIGKEISPSLLGELRARADADHLVHGRGQRDAARRPCRPIFGLHTPQAITTVSASMSPPVVRTRRIAAVLDVQAGDLDGRHDGERAQLQRALAHDRARAQRVDDADARRPEGADDLVRVEERHLLRDERPASTSSDSMPHALRRRHPPAQLLHPLLGARDLEAAGLGEDAQLLVLPHGVERQVGDLAGVVDREDEVRRVAGGAAGVGQRALVDLHDVAPAEPGQVVDEAVADDAGADDDDPGGGGNAH